MSVTDPAPSPPDGSPAATPDPVVAAPATPDTAPGATPGAADLAPQLTPDPVVVTVTTCPICGHADSAHASGRCLVMLGAYGTQGACPCPDVPEPDGALDRRP